MEARILRAAERAMKPRKYHRAKSVRDDGAVSALCFSRARAIDLRKASWTIVDVQVTCKDCLRIMGERAEGGQ